MYQAPCGPHTGLTGRQRPLLAQLSPPPGEESHSGSFIKTPRSPQQKQSRRTESWQSPGRIQERVSTHRVTGAERAGRPVLLLTSVVLRERRRSGEGGAAAGSLHCNASAQHTQTSEAWKNIASPGRTKIKCRFPFTASSTRWRCWSCGDRRS